MRVSYLPNSEMRSSDFKATVNGIDAPLYRVMVSAMPFNRIWPGHQRDIAQSEAASILSFAMDESARIVLTPKKDFKDVIIRPLSANISYTVDGKNICLTVERPGQYSIELDGHHDTVLVLANPDKKFDIAENDANVIYFGPGVYEAGLIDMTDGQTLYIDQDAVVYGYVRAIGAKNIGICGYGILDGSRAVRTDETLLVPQDVSRRNPELDAFSPFLNKYPVAEVPDKVIGTNILKDKQSFIDFLTEVNMLESCVQLYACENVLISGITIRDSVGFTCIAANCENTVFDNIKLVGMWRYNSDGIDLFNSKKCTIKNSFLRNFDDCIVLKGIAGWDTRGMEEILVEKCVIWCDWGRALEIGAETSAPEYKDIVFRDCDIIHSSYAALCINHHDRAHIHNVVYEDIRIEYGIYDEREVYQKSDEDKYMPSHGIPFAVVVTIPSGRGYSNDALKGKINNVYYKNIAILTDNEAEIPSVEIHGRDELHTAEHIEFENMTINGKPYPFEKGLHKNAFAKDVVIK